jgi:hypothetical protein
MENAGMNQLVTTLSREALAEIAPQELPLFRATSEAYFKDPEKTLANRGAKDDPLGFGAGEAVVLLTPVVLAISADVVKFLLEEVKKSAKDQSAAFIGEMVKQMFKKVSPATKEKPPALTPEQLAQVRQIAVKKARQLKLSDDRAKTLADAIVGGLAVASG